jgi:hypothetical protein
VLVDQLRCATIGRVPIAVDGRFKHAAKFSLLMVVP